MCQFNTIIIPRIPKIEKIKSSFRQYGFNLTEIKNKSLSEQLRDKLFFISPKDYCDCGSVISIATLPESRREISDRELDKLRYKGWSETKIKNHIASKLKGQAKMTTDFDSERKKWSDLMRGIFAGADLDSIGILTHICEGDISSEIIKVNGRHKFLFSSFQIEMLDNMSFDEYYEIIRA